MVKEFLKELKDSADIQYKIFTEGSCFRLYLILKTIFPDANAYWSDRDGHCITEIDGKFYDIGGEIHKDYTVVWNYYLVPKEQIKGYSIMKWVNKDTSFSVRPEKYKTEQNIGEI